MLEEKLAILKKEIIGYAGLIEGMIKKSLKGLNEKNREMLLEVIEKDEPKANELEIKLEEFCTSIIAQYQPTARDLRTILMIAKMNNDLERVGDHGVNIVQSALYLIERPQLSLLEISEMGEVVIQMLKDSIDSFINDSVSLCKEVCKRDNVVDELADKVFQKLVNLMITDPSIVEHALHIMRISGNLERIADLSTNICEDVIFIVNGKVIKHHRNETQW